VRRLVAVLTLVAMLVSGMPATGAADLAARSQDLARENALQQQEKSAALTLLSLDEELAADQAQADRIRAALPEAARAVAAATDAMLAARRGMLADREKLGRWLNFFYRYGAVSFLDVVLRARSFDDFVNRLVLVSTLLENQAALWHAASREAAVYARSVAQVQAKRKALAGQEAVLAAAIAALGERQRDKAGFLASLQAQSAALARQVLAEESVWVVALQPLTRVLHDLSALPWDGVTPDSVDFGFSGVTLGFDDATLTRLLDSDQVDFQFTATPDGVVISGEQDGVSFALHSGLAVAGPRTVRLVPRELDLAGAPVQEATLQAVTGGNLTFDLPAADPQWKLSAIRTASHHTDFVFGL